MTLKGPGRWSHLQALLDGYLHQDFVVEHGTAGRAVEAWRADASPQEARAAASEWRSFLNVTAGMDVATRAQVLRELAGGAWAPITVADFDAVSALLTDAWRR